MQYQQNNVFKRLIEIKYLVIITDFFEIFKFFIFNEKNSKLIEVFVNY